MNLNLFSYLSNRLTNAMADVLCQSHADAMNGH